LLNKKQIKNNHLTKFHLPFIFAVKNVDVHRKSTFLIVLIVLCTFLKTDSCLFAIWVVAAALEFDSAFESIKPAKK